MEHTAATPEGEARVSRMRAFAGDVGPKLFITIVAAGITALLIPWITGKWQDHKQQLEVRTSLASDMSRAYTDVIASERFVAFGLVYSAGKKEEQVATNVNAWLTSWHDWLVEAGTLGAQLTARYGVGGISTEWQEYIGAVSLYIRLGAEIPATERPAVSRRRSATSVVQVSTGAASSTRRGSRRFRTSRAATRLSGMSCWRAAMRWCRRSSSSRRTSKCSMPRNGAAPESN